jgi:uncharacterized protein YjiS (DUF1127 family)
MKKIHLMMAMTMVAAVAVRSRMQAVGAASPAAPNLRERLPAGARRLSRSLWRTVNDWVAAAIAHREHRVTLFALRNLSDPELKDFGVYRGRPEGAFRCCRNINLQPGDESEAP